jgi:hypothetical protein
VTTKLERSLQQDVLYRLARYPVVAIPVPNGIWLPAHNEAERAVVARLMARMKTDGMLVPGAPDLVLMGEKRALCIELKRSASRDLFGRKPRGRLSPEQRAFRDRCVDCGVEYIVAECWEDVQCMLPELY